MTVETVIDAYREIVRYTILALIAEFARDPDEELLLANMMGLLDDDLPEEEADDLAA